MPVPTGRYFVGLCNVPGSQAAYDVFANLAAGSDPAPTGAVAWVRITHGGTTNNMGLLINRTTGCAFPLNPPMGGPPGQLNSADMGLEEVEKVYANTKTGQPFGDYGADRLLVEWAV